MEYPEHEKQSKILGKSAIIGEFLEWLDEHEMVIAGYDRDEYYRINKSIIELLAEYFEIDLKKIELEKRQMLEEIRSINKG